MKFIDITMSDILRTEYDRCRAIIAAKGGVNDWDQYKPLAISESLPLDPEFKFRVLFWNRFPWGEYYSRNIATPTLDKVRSLVATSLLEALSMKIVTPYDCVKPSSHLYAKLVEINATVARSDRGPFMDLPKYPSEYGWKISELF